MLSSTLWCRPLLVFQELKAKEGEGHMDRILTTDTVVVTTRFVSKKIKLSNYYFEYDSKLRKIGNRLEYTLVQNVEQP